MFIVKYTREIYDAVKSLLKGMRRTGYYFTHHKEIITQQYPEAVPQFAGTIQGRSGNAA
jgi:NADH-quinone oxidoreductase subunit I